MLPSLKIKKIALSTLLLFAGSLSLSSAFATNRVFDDYIRLLPAGKVSSLHTQGDIGAKLYQGSVNLYNKSEKNGCSSGKTFPKVYFTGHWAFIVNYCAGDGTASFTYTTNDGRVCHITAIDGAGRDNASIQNADCEYTYEKKEDRNGLLVDIQGRINQMVLFGDPAPTDISDL